MDTAVKFLKNPRIVSSPLATKKAFLKSKGLTDNQIEEVCAKAGIANESPETPSEMMPADAEYPLIKSNPQTTWLVRLRDLANVIFVFGGAACGIHYLWKVSL